MNHKNSEMSIMDIYSSNVLQCNYIIKKNIYQVYYYNRVTHIYMERLKKCFILKSSIYF